jgi:hypothetical protein
MKQTHTLKRPYIPNPYIPVLRYLVSRDEYLYRAKSTLSHYQVTSLELLFLFQTQLPIVNNKTHTPFYASIDMKRLSYYVSF